MPHARPRDPRSGGSMSKERTTKESVIVSLVLYWIYFCPEIIFLFIARGGLAIAIETRFRVIQNASASIICSSQRFVSQITFSLSRLL